MSPGASGAHDRTERTLEDILRFCGWAADLCSRGRSAYNDDLQLRLAAEAILHRVGEAAGRLPDEFVAAHPQIPFRAAKAMRNVVAHQYHLIDPELVWTALSESLPALALQVRALLAEQTGDPPA